MVVRNISQAKAELSSLIAMVQPGGEVILSKVGKPVAKIVPYSCDARSLAPGAMEGEVRIAPDFDRLPDDMAEAFGMASPGYPAAPGFCDYHGHMVATLRESKAKPSSQSLWNGRAGERRS